MKTASYITTKSDVNKMIDALNNYLPRVIVERCETGMVVKYTKKNGQQKEVLRAMVGSTGKYLVRHPAALWNAP